MVTHESPRVMVIQWVFQTAKDDSREAFSFFCFALVIINVSLTGPIARGPFATCFDSMLEFRVHQAISLWRST